MDSHSVTSDTGILYVVASPIGNLGDISSRAIETLSSVSRILAEDTRHTQQLLTHLAIKGSLVSLHDHNEEQRVEQILSWLNNGENLALVSDAGTPLISDPGYKLVKELRKHEMVIMAVPGPCAMISALSVAGLPTDRFCFEGFLPAKPAARRKYLELMKPETRTWVFYESTHRIMQCLADMKDVLGPDRFIVISRELTKRFETTLSGTCEQLLSKLTDDINQQRGEFVVMVQGAPVIKESMAEVTADEILSELVAHVPTKVAAQIAANLTGVSKKQLYQRVLELKS